MSFDWKLYVQLAEELITLHQTGGLQEACLRSALSRAYYGVFCTARNHLKGRGINIPPVDTHKFVRKEYLTSSDKKDMEIGEHLKRLWKYRKDADYEDSADICVARAKEAIELAKRTLAKLKEIGAR